MQRRSLAAAVRLSWILMFLLVKSCQIVDILPAAWCGLRLSLCLSAESGAARWRYSNVKCMSRSKNRFSMPSDIRHRASFISHGFYAALCFIYFRSWTCSGGWQCQRFDFTWATCPKTVQQVWPVWLRFGKASALDQLWWKMWEYVGRILLHSEHSLILICIYVYKYIYTATQPEWCVVSRSCSGKLRLRSQLSSKRPQKGSRGKADM